MRAISLYKYKRNAGMEMPALKIGIQGRDKFMASSKKGNSRPSARGASTKTVKKRTGNTTAKKKKAAPKQHPIWILDEIVLWIVIAVAILLLLSNLGLGGYLGGKVSTFLFGSFGFFNYILPVVLFLVTAFFISNKGNKVAWIKTAAMVLFFICLCSAVELLCNQYQPDWRMMDYYQFGTRKLGGGVVGSLLCRAFCPAFGLAGAYVLLGVIMIICLVLITERSLFKGMEKGGKKVYHSAKKDMERRRELASIRREQQELRRRKELEEERKKLREEQEQIQEVAPQPRKNRKVSGVSLDTAVGEPEFSIQRAEARKEPQAPLEDASREVILEEPVVEVMEPEPERSTKNPKSSKKEQEAQMKEVARQIEETAKTVKQEYQFPPLKLLKKPKRGSCGDSDQELRETAMKLQQTLHSFGVEVHISNVSCGPAVTRYELTPEQGVKVSRIVNLADDIKLNLAAADIRIEAPIPGKSAVGIEVPNRENSAVMLRDLLESPEFKNHPSKLAFAAGKDIAGKVVVTDIAKMPHLLIAGATGSGKSVCINTIIMSILYKASPEDVKLIMIDPKVVELSVYNGIPHLFIPVVTDPKKAAGALNWGVAEMTDRYKKFADLNVRDLKGYNAKIESIRDIEDENKPKKLPQIVIIVDELADLMMVAPGEVEDSICRLAQLARAAGIHLIIATQRPSVNVITGLIKANMPSRIAFSVSSGVDSRTIIDMNGAEKLLGKGDMLFYPQGYQKPARVQGAFVSDAEVASVVEFLTRENAAADYSKEIEEQISMAQQSSPEDSPGANDRDAYFVDAGKFIIEKDKASIGMLQRVFKIGFNRAARIMDQLSAAGVVGEDEGTKPRKVLMSMEEFEQYVAEMQ